MDFEQMPKEQQYFFGFKCVPYKCVCFILDWWQFVIKCDYYFRNSISVKRLNCTWALYCLPIEFLNIITVNKICHRKCLITYNGNNVQFDTTLIS